MRPMIPLSFISFCRFVFGITVWILTIGRTSFEVDQVYIHSKFALLDIFENPLSASKPVAKWAKTRGHMKLMNTPISHCLSASHSTKGKVNVLFDV